MNNETNIETFLHVSKEKISISVKNNKTKVSLYENSENKDNYSPLTETNQLNTFLEENIFKIEKQFKQFVKDIILIIDDKKLLEINLSLIKKNFDNEIKKEELTLILNDAKNQIKDNYKETTIIHMIVEKYIVDGKQISNVPYPIKCKNLSIDLNFICLPESFIKELEKVFNIYQIKIKSTLSGQYIKKQFENDLDDIYSLSRKILDGHNENEILLIPKKRENKGFFEKFFNFFS